MRTKTKEYIIRQVKRMEEQDQKCNAEKSNRIGMELYATMKYINEMGIYTMDEMWQIIDEEEMKY